jgi:hypothetical protein
MLRAFGRNDGVGVGARCVGANPSDDGVIFGKLFGEPGISERMLALDDGAAQRRFDALHSAICSRCDGRRLAGLCAPDDHHAVAGDAPINRPHLAVADASGGVFHGIDAARFHADLRGLEGHDANHVKADARESPAAAKLGSKVVCAVCRLELAPELDGAVA